MIVPKDFKNIIILVKSACNARSSITFICFSAQLVGKTDTF